MGRVKHWVEPEPLPDGTYRVTTLFERVLSPEQMRDLDIPVPQPRKVEVPWPQEKAGPPPARLRRQKPARSSNPLDIAMDCYRENFGGFPPGLPDLLPSAIHDLGLERVIDAIFELKRQTFSPVPRLERLKVIFNRKRTGGDGDGSL